MGSPTKTQPNLTWVQQPAQQLVQPPMFAHTYTIPLTFQYQNPYSYMYMGAPAQMQQNQQIFPPSYMHMGAQQPLQSLPQQMQSPPPPPSLNDNWDRYWIVACCPFLSWPWWQS